jgi:hypothetical protein
MTRIADSDHHAKMKRAYGSLTAEQCETIAAWSRRKAAVGPTPRLVVQRDREPGDPFLTEEPAVYVHPEDYLALRRWVDEQERASWVTWC